MSVLPTAVEAALEQPGSHAVWAAITAAIDSEPDIDLDAVNHALARWERDAVFRRPTETQWQAVQTGGELPAWWPLVRHVDLGVWDRLDHLPVDAIRSISIDPECDFEPDLLVALPALERLDVTACAFDAAALVEVLRSQRTVVELIASRSSDRQTRTADAVDDPEDPAPRRRNESTRSAELTRIDPFGAARHLEHRGRLLRADPQDACIASPHRDQVQQSTRPRQRWFAIRDSPACCSLTPKSTSPNSPSSNWSDSTSSVHRLTDRTPAAF